MAVITMTELATSSTPVFRVELRESLKGKPMLSRRFRQRYAAYGMALAVGEILGIAPDLAYPPVPVEEDDDAAEEDEC